MQAEQFTLILYELVRKGALPVELSTCVYHEHFIGFILADVPDYEILDDLGSWDGILLYLRDIQSSNIYGDLSADISPVD